MPTPIRFIKPLAYLLILTLSIMGCATTTPQPHTAVNAIEPTPGATDNGASVGEIITVILLLPIIIPVLALVALVGAGAGAGSSSVSCRGKVYADGTKWRSSCS